MRVVSHPLAFCVDAECGVAAPGLTGTISCDTATPALTAGSAGSQQRAS